MRVFRLTAVAVALVGIVLVTRPFVHGLTFVVRVADMQGTARRLADFDTSAIREREITIPTADGPLRARAYEPVGTTRRTALLVSGLHASGIDEPRLVRLARNLAANALTIVTPDIPELARFEIAPRITDVIEQSAAWLAKDSGLARDGKVGVMGISFSGGLSIIAAGRPSLTDRVAYVFAFGGHHDLTRVLRYLCTGQEPYPPGMRLRTGASDGGSPATDASAGRVQADRDGQPFTRPPHDYGVAVLLLGLADRVVPNAQADDLREAVRRYLWASALDGGVDKSRAQAEFAAVADLGRSLPEPSRTLMRYVVERDVVHLGARLLPLVTIYGGDPSLSVSKSPKPSVPVFLLHGMDDNVIPSLESEYLANDLRARAPVRVLLSGLISHAEADRPVHAGDVMQLASFWGDLLSR